ncbi:MAG TPA: hypothetical protein VEU32_05690 [Burkholderiales bacterium]|nr:hypothetical protein [Burkholderiales bacterium]
MQFLLPSSLSTAVARARELKLCPGLDEHPLEGAPAGRLNDIDSGVWLPGKRRLVEPR